MSLSSNNSVLSHLTALPVMRIPPTTTLAQHEGIDHRVTIQDIERYANLETTVEGSEANCLVHREANPPQKISRLDQQTHAQSRTGWGPGTYPTNYEVWNVALWFVLKLTLLSYRYICHFFSVKETADIWQILCRMVFPSGNNPDLQQWRDDALWGFVVRAYEHV